MQLLTSALDLQFGVRTETGVRAVIGSVIKKRCALRLPSRRLLKPRLLLNSLSLRHRGKKHVDGEREGETSPEWEKRDEIKYISP